MIPIITPRPLKSRPGCTPFGIQGEMDVKKVLSFFRKAIHRMPFRNRLLAIYGGVILLGMTVLILVADVLVRNISEKTGFVFGQQSFSPNV